MRRHEDFNAALVHSYKRAMSSIGPRRVPMQGHVFRCGPGALMHKGHKFNEAQVHSRIAATIWRWPRCTHVQGP